MLSDYLSNLETLFSNQTVRDQATGSVREADDREMREMERNAGVAERNRQEFRWEIYQFFNILTRKGVKYDYTSELRMKAAIDARLFPDRRTLANTLTKPRSANSQRLSGPEARGDPQPAYQVLRILPAVRPRYRRIRDPRAQEQERVEVAEERGY